MITSKTTACYSYTSLMREIIILTTFIFKATKNFFKTFFMVYFYAIILPKPNCSLLVWNGSILYNEEERIWFYITAQGCHYFWGVSWLVFWITEGFGRWNYKCFGFFNVDTHIEISKKKAKDTQYGIEEV